MGEVVATLAVLAVVFDTLFATASIHAAIEDKASLPCPVYNNKKRRDYSTSRRDTVLIIEVNGKCYACARRTGLIPFRKVL